MKVPKKFQQPSQIHSRNTTYIRDTYAAWSIHYTYTTLVPTLEKLNKGRCN